MSISTRLQALERANKTDAIKPLILFLHNAGAENAEPLSIDGFARLPGESWPDYRQRAKRHHEQLPGHLHVLKVRYMKDDQ